jgi:Bax protein
VKTLRALLARLKGLPRPSPRHWQGLGAALAVLAVLLWWAGEGPQEDASAPSASGPAPEQVPDFAALPTVSARKAAFFAFLLPRIEAENQRIDELRARIEALLRAEGPWDGATEAWLAALEERYGLSSPGAGPDRLPRLLRRVDRIPPSLALAQAATESAWGTSRFAQVGRNFFGQWCYSQGCGLVPLLRPEGSEHEVRLFEHSADSVVSYMHNLNSHPAHRSFRVLRAAARREGRPLSGELLAPGLLRYSERRAAYVADLLAIMRFNRLGRFDH